MAYELHRDPRSSHQRIARYVRSLGAAPILDVGAASGQLGRLLDGSGLEIDAIEPDAACAEAARAFYDRILIGPVEEVALDAGHYRLIVCADILEHTVDPAAVIQRLLGSAAPGVRLVVSLPNVAHVAARLVLASGRFPQADRGIFDRTHLHFYTRRTALKLISDAGLRIETLSATPVPLEELPPSRFPSTLREPAMRLQTIAARFAPTAFAYQWLIVARRA